MESLPIVLLSLISKAVALICSLLTLIIQNSTAVTWGLVCVWLAYVSLRFLFQVKITVHPAARETFESMVRKFQAESMFSEEAIPCVASVGDKDADLTPDPQREDIKIVKSSRRVSYAVRVAHVAKAQVGLLANSRANELVYSRLCREEMVKHGVRPSHIAHMVPLAVAACFIPLDSDFLAASIRQGEGMKERRALLGPSWEK
nr:RNA polymerase pre-readthrough protein [Tobacco necrosis virus D]